MPRPLPARRIAVLIFVALSATACDANPLNLPGVPEPAGKSAELAFANDPNLGKSPGDATTEPTPQPSVDAADDVEPAADDPPPRQLDEPEPIEITRRVIDGARPTSIDQVFLVEQFWAQVGTDIDYVYVPLDNDRVFTRSGLQRTFETCSFEGSEQALDSDEVAGNAFVAPCDEGITVVWDNLELGTDLEEFFPGAGLAMLIAHEWGHVVQFQREQFGQNDLIAEQQADCYSGAYARWAQDRAVEPFTNPRALDFAIISTLEARDSVGARPDEAGAHGNGFDRIRATQEGYDRGVAFCAAYDDTPPPVTQMGFAPNSDDEARGGNLPYEPAFELLVPAITAWYESLSDEPLEPLVDLPDDALLRQIHGDIGDAALLAEYGLRYGAALQEAVGDETTGEGAALQRACIVGAYLEDVLANGIGADGQGNSAGSLSPGDLDEVIITLASSDDLLSNPGLVFEMVAALRVGTIDGLDACALA